MRSDTIIAPPVNLDAAAQSQFPSSFPAEQRSAEGNPPQTVSPYFRIFMKKFQFFAHRPPSNTTLLNDPWPTALRIRKYRKTFEWPAYRKPQGADSLKRNDGLGLQA